MTPPLESHATTLTEPKDLLADLNVEPRLTNTTVSLDDLLGPAKINEWALLAGESRWVAWREDVKNGKPSKVPYMTPQALASSSNRGTWLNREQAEQVAAILLSDGQKGGVGLMLGGDGAMLLGGIDLDSCLDPKTGNVEPWAAEIVERFASYSEISPSGLGIKVFFRFRADDLGQLRNAMGTQYGKSWSLGNHTEIALHLGSRYFTVTGRLLSGSADSICHVDRDALLWLIKDAGPRFKRETPVVRCRDESRSGRAFRLAGECRSAGMDLDGFRAALDKDPELADWAKNPRDVQRAFDRAPIRGGIDILDSDFPDLPRQIVPLALIRNKHGTLAATLSNANLILGKTCRLHRWEIRRNEFSGLDEWNSERVTDAHLDFIQAAIEQAGMPNVGKERTFQAMRMHGSQRMYHPVRDYLQGLRWDGTPRLKTWLTTYAKVTDSPYVQSVGRAFLVGMVARIMRPGCKMDNALVLRGRQGLRKSTACSILGGQWYGENMPSIVPGNKDADQYPPGHWLIELAENAPTKKSDQDHLKAFITRTTDELRLPYGRMFDKFERQCVFVVTTNQHEFLRDDTGGRRWWPVTVESEIDIDALSSDRDQLFAEAKSAFDNGEPWHLSTEMEKFAEAMQEDALESDPWDETVSDFLNCPEFNGKPRAEIRMCDVLTNGLNLPIMQQDRKTQQRVAGIMRKLGWEKTHMRTGKIWKRA